MKKIIFAAALSLASAAFAQVLPSPQFKNTVWSGFGNPYAGDTMFYGFADTFQARVDRGNFTIEGMLNTGLLANYDNNGDVDNFTFGTSNQNALNLHYGRYPNYYSSSNTCGTLGYNNAVNSQNTIQDSYYVNFIWHLSKNFDLGAGTKLNWQVGPAPRYGAWLWEPEAHSRQGGFSTAYDDRAGARAGTANDGNSGTYKFTVDRPGSADVVGFVPYANKYAKKALAFRFHSNDSIGFELGGAIPNGFNTDDPGMHFGLKIAPADWLSIGAAIEGAFDDAANFYTGATIGAKNFVLEVYLAADRLFTDVKDDQAYGTGANITFIIPNTSIKLTPELGINFFENDNYDFAWYTGCGLYLPFSKKFSLNVWGSAAFGSKDKRWDDNSATREWDGGRIFSIKPGITYIIDSNLTFDAYINLEKREAFDGKSRGAWSSGAFLTYTF